MARIVDGPEITGQVVHKQTGQAYGPVTVTVSPKVYTDREMTASVTSLTTDGTGVFSCYAPPGTYAFTTTAVDAQAIESVEVLGREGGTGVANAASSAPLDRGWWAPSTAYAVNDLVQYGRFRYIRTTAGTSGATFSASNWTRVSPLDAPWKGEQFGSWGHSWLNDTGAASVYGWDKRFRDQNQFNPNVLHRVTNGGYWMQDVFWNMSNASNPFGGNVGYIGLMGVDAVVNDAVAYQAASAGDQTKILNGFYNSTFGMAEYLRALSRQTDASIGTYTGTWSTVTATGKAFGGAYHQTTTLNDTVDFFYTTSATSTSLDLWLLGGDDASATAGATYSVAVDGVTATTGTLSNQCKVSTSTLATNLVPVVVKLTGLAVGGGNRHIVITKTDATGTALRFNGYTVPPDTGASPYTNSTVVPTGLDVIPIVFMSDAPTASVGAGAEYNAYQAMLTKLNAVATLYQTQDVFVCDLMAAGFDYTKHVTNSQTGGHPNDRGHQFIADTLADVARQTLTTWPRRGIDGP